MKSNPFGLQQPAFSDALDAAFFRGSPVHHAALAAVSAAIRDDDRLVIVTGGDAVDRSAFTAAIAEVAPEELGGQAICVRMVAGQSLQAVLARTLSEGLGAGADKSADDMLGILRQASESSRSIVVDGAEHLTADDAELLQRITNSDIQMGTIVVGDDGVQTLLPAGATDEPSAGTKVKLRALTASETGVFLRARMREAGASETDVFSNEAIKALSALADGRLCRLNALAMRAMDAASARGAHQVQAEDVTEMPDASAEVLEAAAEQVARHAIPTTVEIDRIADIVGRFEAILERAPGQVEQIEVRLEQVQQRAEQMIKETTARAQADALQEMASSMNMDETIERFERLQRSASEASDIEQRLATAVKDAQRITSQSQERMSLLLASLETAQTIHDDLQGVGREVSELVTDSRQGALDEHEKLKAMFKQLVATREEFNTSLDALERKREAVTERCKETAADQIKSVQRAGQKALAEARQIRDEAKHLTADAKTAIRQVTDRLERMEVQGREMSMSAERVQHATARSQELTSALQEEAERSRSLLGRMSEQREVVEQLQSAERQERIVIEQLIASAREEVAGVVREGMARFVEAERRLESGVGEELARIEESIAAEKQIRSTAEKAARSAHGLLSQVAETEARLASAQDSAITIDAVAATALSTIQAKIGRADEAVDSLVRSGLERMQDALATALADAETRQSETIAQIDERTSQIDEQLSQRSTALMNEVVQQVRGRVSDIYRETVRSLEEQITAQREELVAQESSATASASALGTQIDALRQDAQERLAAVVKTALAELDQQSRHMQDAVCAQGAAVTQASTRKIESRVEALAADLDHRVESAREMQQALDAMLAQARQAHSEGRTCQEQIGHLVRDIWSLTSTTDQRISALRAMLEQGDPAQSNLRRLIDKAESSQKSLLDRVSLAERCTKTMADQQVQVGKLCTSFGERIKSAREVYGALSRSCATGQELQSTLTDETMQIQQNLEMAQALAIAAGDQQEQVAAAGQAIKLLAEELNILEMRFNEVREGMRAPQTIIEQAVACSQAAVDEATRRTESNTQRAEQAIVDAGAQADARVREITQRAEGAIQEASAQAEALNRTCDAVKRIFAGLAKSSLELREMLSASDKAVPVLQRWVGEARHVQQRLAGTIEQAPSAGEVLPTLDATDATAQPGDATPAVAEVSAVDEPAPPAPPSGSAMSPGAMPTAPAIATKAVESLAGAMRRKPAVPQGQEPGAVIKAAAGATRPRLSAEDVRALIEEAKRKSAPAKETPVKS